MGVDLTGRSFLDEVDFTAQQWHHLLDLSAELTAARSIVRDQAENWLHTTKAILVATLGG